MFDVIFVFLSLLVIPSIFLVINLFIILNYIKLRIQAYIDLCYYTPIDPSISEDRKAIFDTEILSMRRCLDIINYSLKANPFKLLKFLKLQKRINKLREPQIGEDEI